ncbi:MAG: hypothetical protein ACW97Z_08010 [Candidatus Hodarchaeales archaeon]|jgi:hypothetical protein
MARPLLQPSQERLQSTIEYLNYTGPVFTSVRSELSTDDTKSSLKIIGSSAF